MPDFSTLLDTIAAVSTPRGKGGVALIRAQEAINSLKLTGDEATGAAIVFRAVESRIRTEAEMREELSSHPVIQKFQKEFDAVLVRCTPVNR